MEARAAVDFVEDGERAAAMLHPVRLKILEALGEPDSAAGLARRFGMPRQTVNYHVRELARAGLLKRAGQRKRRNMTERRYVATAKSYVLSPEILGHLGVEAGAAEDRFSAAYLLALTARLQTEVGRAMRAATEQGKRVATLSVSADVRFESAEQRTKFAEELQGAVLEVAGRYASPMKKEDGRAGEGRPYRLLVGCYPAAGKKEEK